MPNVSRWDGLANSFTLPAGMGYGRGWVLLTLSDLQSMKKDSLFEQANQLVFKAGSNLSQSITLKDIYVCGDPTCILPTYQNDPNQIFVVPLADKRYLLHNKYFSYPINSQFNVLNPDGASEQNKYYQSTIKDPEEGVTYEFQDILDKIWEEGLQDIFTQDSPDIDEQDTIELENLRFPGVSRWAAYNEVLRMVQSRFVLGIDGSCKIVKINGPDTNYDQAIAKLVASKLRHDGDFSFTCDAVRIPASIDVMFHVFCKHYGAEWTTSADEYQWSLQQIYVKNVTTSANSFPGTKGVIWSPKVVIKDLDITVENQDEVDDEAKRLVDNHVRMWQGPFNKDTFVGFLTNENVRPGAKVSAISWYDVGNGPFTTVTCSPIQYRVDDNRMLQELYSEDVHENIRPPDIARKSFPLYPHLQQIVKIKSPAPQNGYFDAVLMHYNPDNKSWEEGEKVWVLDVNM